VQGWEKLKPTTPMGQMPGLTIDGCEGVSAVSRTAAIDFYLGATLDLAGTSAYESARCVMMAGGLEDQTKHFGPITKALLMEKDEAKCKELANEYETGELKVFAEHYEGFLVANGGQVLVGKEVSVR